MAAACRALLERRGGISSVGQARPCPRFSGRVKARRRRPRSGLALARSEVLGQPSRCTAEEIPPGDRPYWIFEGGSGSGAEPRVFAASLCHLHGNDDCSITYDLEIGGTRRPSLRGTLVGPTADLWRLLLSASPALKTFSFSRHHVDMIEDCFAQLQRVRRVFFCN